MPLNRRALVAALAALLLIAGCSVRGGGADAARSAGIRVASFDFSESVILAQVYAAALERRGYPVARIDALGPREIVQPALAQGLVDVVPEYVGSALAFLAASGDAASTAAGGGGVARLRSALRPRGLVALTPAPAQDRNGFVVTARTAAQHRLRRISDLRPLARSLVFGGPAECPQRPYCLPGLQARYQLTFKAFVPMPTRAVTADALEAGEIGVGMLETTDGHLAGGRLVLLADDAGLQPAENVVPVLRRSVLDRYGSRLADVLDAVSARLTPAVLIGLNRRVDVDGEPTRRVAEAWVQGALP